MPGTKQWFSTPDELRHRLEVHWTLPRPMIASIRERANAEGVSVSRVAEEALDIYLALPLSTLEGLSVLAEEEGTDITKLAREVLRDWVAARRRPARARAR